MIKFNILDDADSALAHSPLLRGINGITAYVKEHGGVGLTKSGAFDRKFVHWAAAEFDWPGYSEADLFAVNKVLNEADFPPLVDLHDVLVALRIGERRKGRFLLSSSGQTFADRPGQLFGIIAPFFLIELDPLRWSRTGDYLVGNWDVWLNVINVEAEDGATASELRSAMYGKPISSSAFDSVVTDLYVQVLRPLCWAGLLLEEPDHPPSIGDRTFTKTPLWRAALQLRTDTKITNVPGH